MTKESQTVRNRKTFNNPKRQTIILFFIHWVWGAIFATEGENVKTAELCSQETWLFCDLLQAADNDTAVVTEHRFCGMAVGEELWQLSISRKVNCNRSKIFNFVLFKYYYFWIIYHKQCIVIKIKYNCFTKSRLRKILHKIQNLLNRFIRNSLCNGKIKILG